jgi:predicted PurR-regulated permease PerM
VIIFAFLVLGMLLGSIIGAFLAVPATKVASVVLDELAEKRPSLVIDEEGEEPRKTEKRKADP